MDAGRLVMIRYDDEGVPRMGSGLRIGGNRVLTADHVAAGSRYKVLLESGEKRATVLIRSHDPAVDLAILQIKIPLGEELSWLTCARVDRTIMSTLPGCRAVGFPNFKKSKAKDRRSAQVDGVIQTAEGNTARPGIGITAGYLSLKATGPEIRDWPPIPHASRDGTPACLQGSPWEGMSGAVVFSSTDQILGVIRHHNPAEGTGTLTLTPFDALDSLPEPCRSEFWTALGISDPQQLPVLPPRNEKSLHEKYSRAHRFLVARLQTVSEYQLTDSLSVMGMNAGEGQLLKAQSLASTFLQARDLMKVSRAVEALCPADPELAVEIATRVFPYTWLDETHARWLRDIVNDPYKQRAAATRSQYQHTCEMLFRRAYPDGLDEKGWEGYPVGLETYDAEELLETVRTILCGEGGIPAEDLGYSDDDLRRRMKEKPCVLYLPPGSFDVEMLRPLRETFPDLTLFFWKLGPEDIEARGLDFISCVQLPEKPADYEVRDAVVELRGVGR